MCVNIFLPVPAILVFKSDKKTNNVLNFNNDRTSINDNENVSYAQKVINNNVKIPPRPYQLIFVSLMIRP